MQTSFTLAQLADPDVAESEKILRACVHCGFCTATCPTYVLDGNELDSPRGRIYLIKDMLENDRPATAEVTLHIDRCLSCLACMTTCPSGVHYMHLVDHARAHIEKTYRRPAHERLLRAMLAMLLPYPRRFRPILTAALAGKPLARLAETVGLKRLAAMLQLAPAQLPHRPIAPQTFAAAGARTGRVALLTGCVNDLLAPQINEAAIRVLTRLGIEVVVAQGSGCCGSLVHHMGREDEALRQARANIDAWTALGALDAVVRHHGERLWFHVPHRFGLCGTGRQSGRSCARYHRISGDVTGAIHSDNAASRGRLSRRLLAAARAASHARAQGDSQQTRLRREGRSGRSSVLRLGWNVQYSAAGHRKKVARAQSQDYRGIAT
jgi:ferredoxin